MNTSTRAHCKLSRQSWGDLIPWNKQCLVDVDRSPLQYKVSVEFLVIQFCCFRCSCKRSYRRGYIKTWQSQDGGNSTDPAKTDKVAKWPPPTPCHQLQQFLGLLLAICQRFCYNLLTASSIDQNISVFQVDRWLPANFQ